MLCLFVIGGQVSFAFNASSTSEYIKYEVLSQGSGDNNSHGFHYIFESEEQEISKDSEVENNEGFDIPFTPFKTLSYLNKLQSRISVNQYTQTNRDNRNRAVVSLVVLYHSWKGFII